jgi:hypothetical protein
MSTPVDTPAEPFVHPALFYRGADEYLAGTVPFIRSGLAAREPVAVAVPGPNLALLCAELGADAGHVRLMDMNTAGRNPGRIIPGVLRAFADTHPGQPVRIIGEPIWASRTDDEYPACGCSRLLCRRPLPGHWGSEVLRQEQSHHGLTPRSIDRCRTNRLLLRFVDRSGLRSISSGQTSSRSAVSKRRGCDTPFEPVKHLLRRTRWFLRQRTVTSAFATAASTWPI